MADKAAVPRCRLSTCNVTPEQVVRNIFPAAKSPDLSLRVPRRKRKSRDGGVQSCV